MLANFSFKNYKSFRDEATLDLNSTKITEFSDSVITCGGNKILPVAAIFGANASGKSTVFSAFEYMSNYVAYSFNYGDEKEKFSKFRPTLNALNTIIATSKITTIYLSPFHHSFLCIGRHCI